MLTQFKRFDEAIRELQTARQLNPTAQFIQNQLTQTYLRAHRFEEGIAEARKAILMDPDDRTPHIHLVRAFLYMRRPAEALEELGKSHFSDQLRDILTAEISLQTANRAEGEKYFRTKVANFSPSDNYTVFAEFLVKINEIDKAFEFLQKAFDAHESIIVTVGVEPEFDPIRSDPRYAVLMERLGLPK